jgi:hypothetical protein
VRRAHAVSCNEVLLSEHPGTGSLVVTTAGDDAASIRTTIDRVAHQLRTHPTAVVTRMDTEVFPWHPDDHSWSDIEDSDPWEEKDG